MKRFVPSAVARRSPLLIALVGLAAPACAPSPHPTIVAPAPQQPVAPPIERQEAPVLAPVVATHLTFGFEADTSSPEASRTSEQIGAGLARVGFRFAEDPAAATDARFVMRVTADDASGQPKVSLVLVRDEATIEWATAVVADATAEAGRLESLVARMCRSASVEAFAVARVEHREREAARNRSLPRFAPEKQQTAPAVADPGLGASALRRCRNARDESACEPVRAYLRDHPNGAQAAQAEAAWSVASARFARQAGQP